MSLALPKRRTELRDGLTGARLDAMQLHSGNVERRAYTSVWSRTGNSKKTKLERQQARADKALADMQSLSVVLEQMYGDIGV